VNSDQAPPTVPLRLSLPPSLPLLLQPAQRLTASASRGSLCSSFRSCPRHLADTCGIAVADLHRYVIRRNNSPRLTVRLTVSRFVSLARRRVIEIEQECQMARANKRVNALSPRASLSLSLSLAPLSRAFIGNRTGNREIHPARIAAAIHPTRSFCLL